ncbi:MAG: DUF302 domain-containing protein [Brevinema sp.]
MMRKMLFLMVLFSLNNIYAQEVTKKEVQVSVDQAVKELKTIMKSKNLTIFAELDHQKAAKTVKLEMPVAKVLIFGNPAVGTMLMNDNIAWSYELPLKIAIYQDPKGQTWIQYRTMAKDVTSSKDKTPIIDNMNALLKNLADSIN